MLQLNLKSRLTNTTGRVEVQNGILISLDQREVTVHVLLDISTASRFAVSASASLSYLH